jgi:hypothetical protein
MAVHDIDVNHRGAGTLYPAYLIAKARKVGR